MTNTQITVSVGGGHALDQAGLAALINQLPGLHVVPLEQSLPPQVLIWDAHTTKELPIVQADTAILLLAENAVYDSLPETVAGLFSKDESAVSLGIAIRQVARGEQYISPALAVAIIQKRQENSLLTNSEKPIVDTLTEREREILKLLAQGFSNKLIAARLYLSVRTVEGHLANIYSRLNIHSRTEAMLLAVRIK